ASRAGPSCPRLRHLGAQSLRSEVLLMSRLLPRALLVAGLGVGLLLPFAVRANDQFSDVTDPLYHDAVNQLKASGITTGCTPTPFCPDGLVSRWQMALFLVRGLGLNGTPAANTYVSRAKTVDDNAITSAKLADGAVGTVDLADASVTVGKLNA